MKTLKYLFPLFALALACEKEPQGPEQQQAQELTIVASTDGTIIPEWKADDQIKVVYAEEMYTFAADKAGKSASFTDTEGKLTADMIKEGPVSAYYNCTNMFGTFRIQAEQTYKDGASSATIPAYAYTMNTPENNMLAMTFKPLASVLKLEVAPYEMTIEKIIIKPAEGAVISEGALAGGFTANAAQGSVKVSNEINEVVVNLASPADLKQGATFNIPLGWFAIEGGLQITLIYDGVKEYHSTIWKEGVVKSYNDEGGLKSAKVMTETYEFDANAFPRAWYVKADASASAKGVSWDAPATLSYALANALPGSVLHVAAGTYAPEELLPASDSLKNTLDATDILKSFYVANNITIIGGYPANAKAGAVADAAANATILDGKGKSLHTMVVAAPVVAGEKVVIEGVTVKGGNNTADHQSVIIPFNNIKLAGNYAAGVAVYGTVVEMKNVTVTGNNGHCAAGLYCAGSEITMTGCKVDGNIGSGNGAGAWFTTGTKLVMDGCSVSKNTTSALCAGLYLYVPAGKSLEAEIKNSHFDENSATGNAGGAYVRDDSGENLMKSSFTNCTFDGNSGTMGASTLILNAATSFNKCSFSNNRNTGNGIVYLNTTGTSSAEALFDGCVFSGNACKEGAAAGCMGGLYCYNNSTAGTVKAYVVNSLFENNDSNGRGSGIYARNNQAKDVYLLCANTTFVGNSCGSVGSAINLYGAAAKKTVADVVSCTITGNISKHETNFAALCCETAGTTMNVYNTICAGNKTASGAVCDAFNKAGTMTHKYSFVGADYYGADAAVATVTPAFDFATMLGQLADNGGDTKTIKLVGNASSNPAFGNGMAVADLKALANGSVSADALAKDQTGAARTDADKIVGACVKK